jgi:hypothetical protein
MNATAPDARRILLVVAWLAAPAMPATDAGSDFAAQMRACSVIAHHGERLSCYDRVAATDAHVAPESDAAAARIASFGLLVGAQPAPAARNSQLDEIVEKVRRAGRREDEFVYVELDNGQLWRINGRDPLLRPGHTVVIRRAVMGSFTMSVPSGRAVKVHRVR